MNLNLKPQPHEIGLKRKIVYIIIIIICIVSILLGSYIQVFKKDIKVGSNKKNNYIEIEEEQYAILENGFTNLFKNDFKNNSNYDFSKTAKLKENDNIISNIYVNTETKDNQYSLNVTIPYININSTTIQKYNIQIQNLFKQKAESIIQSNLNNNIIYSVEYAAYVNSNILSLVIRSTLKESENALRIIVQTYNYNLEKNKTATIDDALQLKGISKNYAEGKVMEKIKIAQEKVERLNTLGYNIFNRDYKSDMYKMQNTSEFFLGDDGHLYLIYAYGNNNYTSELDLVIL